MANTVEVVFEDRRNMMASLKLNGTHLARVGIDHIPSPRNPFNRVARWSTRLANIHNQSNPITFRAATMETLVKKIEKHEYQLVVGF